MNVLPTLYQNKDYGQLEIKLEFSHSSFLDTIFNQSYNS